MIEQNDPPGTLQHQRMLHAILSYYENDPRILAVIVFGSLGRGDWDRYSDLDLDVVIADGIQIDVEAELLRLCAACAPIDEQIALLIPYGDEADVVFQSCLELSIRYHPLAGTSPSIIDSMVLLSGRIPRSAVEAAGMANQKLEDEPIERELDRCIRYALEVDNALRRGWPWSAIELLHYTRRSLMALFSRSHGGQRTYQFFEKEAGQRLQDRLGGTLPQYDLKSVRQALAQILDMLAHDLDALTAGQVSLTRAQAELLERMIARQ
jgi:hypothetical protein